MMQNKILIELIDKINLSQKEISKQTGIPESRLSEWVKGVRSPKKDTLEKITKHFGYKIEISWEIKNI